MPNDILPEDALEHRTAGALEAELATARKEASALREALEIAEERTRIAEGKLETVIQNNADSVLILNEMGEVVLANAAAEELFQRDREEMQGKQLWIPVVAGGPTEFEIDRPGRAKTVAEMRVVEIDWNDQPAFLATLRDMTQRVRVQEELRTMAMMDELTGLYNRRAFLTLAEQYIKFSNRKQKGMYLLYLDLDGLKRINDTNGHLAGDRALIEVSHILKRTFRESDVIARLGGDEFAVLALEALPNSAQIILDRLEQNLAAFNARPEVEQPLSFSVGTAFYDPRRILPLEDLLRMADTAMYEVKRTRPGTRASRSAVGLPAVAVDEDA